MRTVIVIFVIVCVKCLLYALLYRRKAVTLKNEKNDEKKVYVKKYMLHGSKIVFSSLGA